MKTFLLLVVLAVAGKMGWDRYQASQTDRNMARVVDTINQTLPRTSGFIRVEKVVYSDRVMHFSGTLLGGQEISPELKSAAENQLRTQYCGGDNELRKFRIGVEYAFTRTGLRSLSDKLQPPEEWSVTLRPESCI